MRYMDNCFFEIKSGMYGEPIFAAGSCEEDDRVLRYRWTEKHGEKENPSEFEFTFDKATGVTEVIRSGDMSSVMTFDTGRPTKGSLDTVYGVIEIDINTHYINAPSVLAEALEISYTLDSGSNEPIKNLFSIKKLLQNPKI